MKFRQLLYSGYRQPLRLHTTSERLLLRCVERYVVLSTCMDSYGFSVCRAQRPVDDQTMACRGTHEGNQVETKTVL